MNRLWHWVNYNYFYLPCCLSSCYLFSCKKEWGRIPIYETNWRTNSNLNSNWNMPFRIVGASATFSFPTIYKALAPLF